MFSYHKKESMDFQNIKYVIVGSGFFGSVLAERIANDLGEDVVVLEQRDHLGGNSFSCLHDETGIEVHKYGSHISIPQTKLYGSILIVLALSIIIGMEF